MISYYDRTCFQKMDNECQRLCMKESDSVLRSTSPASLIQFKMKDVKEEILQNAPVLSSLLQQICTAKRSKSKRQTHINEIVVPTMASLILHSRCPEMSAFSYRLGLLLRHAAYVFTRCSHLGVISKHITIRIF